MILAVLLTDYFYVRKRDLRLPAGVMTFALAANSMFIVALMIPQFLGEAPEMAANLSDAENLLFLGHAASGAVAEILALFVVLRWAFRSFRYSACKGKRLMRATDIAWVAAVILGIVIFWMHVIE